MKRRTFLKFAAYGGAAALVGSYPIFIERTLVQVNKYRIPVQNLPPAFHGLTIAQLTDLHFGFLVSEAFVEGIVHRTNALRTDVIVCTGDYVHRSNTIEEIDKV
jgi:predicted MPP superfamily phosphohydrolase